jgi:hypothetical protein
MGYALDWVLVAVAVAVALVGVDSTGRNPVLMRAAGGMGVHRVHNPYFGWAGYIARVVTAEGCYSTSESTGIGLELDAMVVATSYTVVLDT